MKRIERNIKVDYIYKFFSAFDITAAIWVLYLGYKGLNLIEIGLLESIFHITGFLFEIPTGAIADLLGRKKVIILGRFSFLISCIVMLFSNSFFGFAVAFVIQAISYNLNSGSEEALVYDSLKVINKEDTYTKVSGKISLLIEISQGLAVFIGGLLSEKSFSLSYIAAILIGLFALAIAFSFEEVEIEKERESINVINHFKDCFITLKLNKRLVKFLMYFPWIFAFSTTTYFYGQQNFSDLGFSRVSISMIFLINGAFSSIGAILSSSLDKKLKGKRYVVIPLFIGISILLFGYLDGFSSLIMFWVVGFFTAALYPISSNKLNELIPSNQRATILSIESMICSLAMIIIFPLVGFVGELVTLKFALIILGVAAISLSILEVKKDYS